MASSERACHSTSSRTRKPRICDGCPRSLVEAMCDFQVSDIQVSPLLLRRILAAADATPGTLESK